jgi:signal transduction histidine kinase
MQGVGDQIGRVLDRERETARLAELVWREQQDLLHTLHDSLGQTLTGLGMLSSALEQRLAGVDRSAAAMAAEIARLAQDGLDRVRLLAKSLFPIDIDAYSLLSALLDLASATEALHGIRVRVEGRPSQALRNSKVATELYRITQEAVTNSVKHGRARAIVIRFEEQRGLMRLQIVDDGVGIREPTGGDGAGLRIMRHRAASIGAALSVEPGAGGGTVVACTLRTAGIPGGASVDPSPRGAP